MASAMLSLQMQDRHPRGRAGIGPVRIGRPKKAISLHSAGPPVGAARRSTLISQHRSIVTAQSTAACASKRNQRRFRAPAGSACVRILATRMGDRSFIAARGARGRLSRQSLQPIANACFRKNVFGLFGVRLDFGAQLDAEILHVSGRAPDQALSTRLAMAPITIDALDEVQFGCMDAASRLPSLLAPFAIGRIWTSTGSAHARPKPVGHLTERCSPLAAEDARPVRPVCTPGAGRGSGIPELDRRARGPACILRGLRDDKRAAELCSNPPRVEIDAYEQTGFLTDDQP